MAAGPTCSSPSLTADQLIGVVARVFHANSSEWLFFRELRVGTGRRNGSAQRVDAFALNCYPFFAMKRICYEVKVSRADFLLELRHPLKRRIGMRYSNEFYFVTPAGLLDHSEIPPECGLVEAGGRELIRGTTLFGHDELSGLHCAATVPAPWRETPGPTWELVAAMLRNQRREFEERPPKPPSQVKFTF